MIISVASGKGGTGKTTVSVNLARAAGASVNLLDVDVEEPNCHIFLKDLQYKTEDIFAKVPVIDKEKCSHCGKCTDICQFNAIADLSHKILLFEELCHSCGGCMLFCPEKAIGERNKKIGTIYRSKYENINFIYGEMDIGYPMSPPVISAVKNNITNNELHIIDCPPGVSCPAIEGLKNSDYSILVTDPTPFALHDLKLSVEALRYLKIPFGVFVNRCDIGNNELYDYCKKENITILAELPNDLNIARSYSKGEILIEALPEHKKVFEQLLNKVKEEING